MYRKFRFYLSLALLAAPLPLVAQPPPPPSARGGAATAPPPGGREARPQYRRANPRPETQPPRPNPVVPATRPAEAVPASTAPPPTQPPGHEAPPQVTPAPAEKPAPPPIDTAEAPAEEHDPGDLIIPPRSAVPPLVAFELEVAGEDWGRFVLELNEEKAPLTVANFLRYVDDGFYAGTIFHRIIPDFLVQGGGDTAIEVKKTEGLRRAIRSESRNGLKNLRATVGLARARNPHTGAAQFYINLTDNPRLDYPSRDGFGYTVFGKVVEGWDVIERMAALPRQQDRTGKPVDTTPSEPLTPPRIRRALRVEPSAAPAAPTGSSDSAPAPDAGTPPPPPSRPPPRRDEPDPPADESPPT